ncbi:MAG: hypothetical protein R2799_00335 [Crocinitomicaceae bacterium]
MKLISYILLFLIITSCSTTKFAKRRYMRGVYVEKHSDCSIASKKVKSKVSSHSEKINLEDSEPKNIEDIETFDTDNKPMEDSDQFERSEKKFKMKIEHEKFQEIPKRYENHKEENSEGKNNNSELFWIGFSLVVLGIIFLSLQSLSMTLLLSLGLIAIIVGLVLAVLGFRLRIDKRDHVQEKSRFKKASIWLWVSFGIAILTTAILIAISFSVFSFTLVYLAIGFGLLALLLLILASIFTGINKSI